MLELRQTGTASLVRDRAAAFNFDRFVGTPNNAISYYRALADAGMHYFIASVSDTQTLRLLAEEVMPEVANA
jgi:hypothetical protein